MGCRFDIDAFGRTLRERLKMCEIPGFIWSGLLIVLLAIALRIVGR